VGLRNIEDFVVSHLLFEGYILIYCEANSEQIHNLCHLFYVLERCRVKD
jgi:hypothetical protein